MTPSQLLKSGELSRSGSRRRDRWERYLLEQDAVVVVDDALKVRTRTQLFRHPQIKKRQQKSWEEARSDARQTTSFCPPASTSTNPQTRQLGFFGAMGAPQGRLGPAVEALATLLTSRDPVRCPPLRPRSPQPVVWRTIGDALARRFGDPNQVKLDSLKDARDITERLYLVVPESLSTDDENEAYAWVSGFKTAVLAT